MGGSGKALDSLQPGNSRAIQRELALSEWLGEDQQPHAATMFCEFIATFKNLISHSKSCENLEEVVTCKSGIFKVRIKPNAQRWTLGWKLLESQNHEKHDFLLMRHSEGTRGVDMGEEKPVGNQELLFKKLKGCHMEVWDCTNLVHPQRAGIKPGTNSHEKAGLW